MERVKQHVVPVSVLATFLITCVSAQAQKKSPVEAGAQRSSSSEELFNRVSPSVFVVEALDEDGSVVAMGSGVAVQISSPKLNNRLNPFDDLDRFIKSIEANAIVTNSHVIDVGVSFRVRQGQKTWPAKIEHIDLHGDICRLRVQGLNTAGVQLRYLKDVEVGERAYSVGAPEGLELTISEGLVSGLRDLDGERVIQTSAAVSHGSSGGGLFGSDGRLIGITTFSFVRGQNLNFALPTDSLLEPSDRLDSELILRHTRHRFDLKDVSEADKKLADAAVKAISRNPDDAEAHYTLGALLLGLDSHQALVEFEKAVRLKPEDPRLHEELGCALERIGDPYGAVQELRKSLRIDPANQWTRSRFIRALITDNDMDSAISETRTFTELLGRTKSTLPIEFLQRVAVWMIEAGENDSARAVCEIFETSTIGSGDGHRCLETALRQSQLGNAGALNRPKSEHPPN